jgi:hypothetical protein
MTKTKTTPTHKIDVTLLFDRDNATTNAIPNKLAQLKEYLNLNAPLYENYILFAGGTQCDILGATGSRFVIYMHESQAEEVRSFIGKLCKGLQLYIGDRNGIPQRV